MGPREEQKSSTQAVVTHNPYHPDGKNRAYPKEWEQRLLLPDGTHIFVRPVRPDDDELFRNFAKGVSEDDTRLLSLARKRN
jgi:acetyltransferase